MVETREPQTQEAGSWSRRRRWTVGIIVVVVAAELFAFAPTPVFHLIQTNNARQLVDEVAAGRDDVLARQDEGREPLERLGAPVQSWTQVSCWLAPRTSDGDGETGLIMFYWQECALIATEIYAVPDELGDGTAVATWLRSRASGEGTCEVTLYGVLEPDIDTGNSDEYNTDLRWIDPAGEPPADQPWSCTLPTASAPDTAHVTVSIDEPMTANSYVAYQVRSPIARTDVGCERGWSWLASCAGEPDGFPVM